MDKTNQPPELDDYKDLLEYEDVNNGNDTANKNGADGNTK